MKTNVGFIGFGLIAGSLAHALKESGRDYHITATSRHLEPVIAAVADGIVDVAAPAVDETFAQCDIILLCTLCTCNYYHRISYEIESHCQSGLHNHRRWKCKDYHT